MKISESMLNIESPKIFIGRVKDVTMIIFHNICPLEKKNFGQKFRDNN